MLQAMSLFNVLRNDWGSDPSQEYSNSAKCYYLLFTEPFTAPTFVSRSSYHSSLLCMDDCSVQWCGVSQPWKEGLFRNVTMPKEQSPGETVTQMCPFGIYDSSLTLMINNHICVKNWISCPDIARIICIFDLSQGCRNYVFHMPINIVFFLSSLSLVILGLDTHFLWPLEVWRTSVNTVY